MAINDVEIFKSNIKTMKETSLDKAGKDYVSHSPLNVVWFDNVMKNYLKPLSLRDELCSADAFYCVSDNEQYLIEFKNSPIENITCKDIIKKMLGSALVVSALTDTAASVMRNRLKFILVYNKNKINDNTGKSSKKSSHDHSLSKTNFANSKLEAEEFRQRYYKDIIVLDKCDFKEEFSNEWEKSFCTT